MDIPPSAKLLFAKKRGLRKPKRQGGSNMIYNWYITQLREKNLCLDYSTRNSEERLHLTFVQIKNELSTRTSHKDSLSLFILYLNK